jgi:hypothetical protein
LTPNQTEFGVEEGVEAAIHATRNFIQENPGCATLKIDFKNAFNCVSRDTFLQEIRTHCPKIINYIASSYDTNSFLSYNDTIIQSSEGAQQGDPIGPLLFCLAIQPIIKKINTKLNVWYLDDGTIGDTIENVLSNLSLVVTEAKKIGLEVNKAKCELILGAEVEAMNIPEAGIKILARDEMFLLGSGLNDPSTKGLIQQKQRELKIIFNKLAILPSHYALHVLRNCYTAPKIMHVLRTAPCFNDDMLLDMLRKPLFKAISRRWSGSAFRKGTTKMERSHRRRDAKGSNKTTCVG